MESNYDESKPTEDSIIMETPLLNIISNDDPNTNFILNDSHVVPANLSILKESEVVESDPMYDSFLVPENSEPIIPSQNPNNDSFVLNNPEFLSFEAIQDQQTKTLSEAPYVPSNSRITKTQSTNNNFIYSANISLPPMKKKSSDNIVYTNSMCSTMNIKNPLNTRLTNPINHSRSNSRIRLSRHYLNETLQTNTPLENTSTTQNPNHSRNNSPYYGKSQNFIRKDSPISLNERDRVPIFTKSKDVSITNHVDPDYHLQLARQDSDDFNFVNEKNLDQETFDKINLTISTVQKDQYHNMLEKSLTENEQFKNVVNQLLKEYTLIAPERNKAKSEHKELYNIPAEERVIKILGTYMSEIKASQTKINRLSEEKDDILQINNRLKKELNEKNESLENKPSELNERKYNMKLVEEQEARKRLE